MVNTDNIVEVKGKLTAVTVFRDRAQLTYAAETNLTRGTHTLRLQLDAAYTAWKSNTLQIRLEGARDLPIHLRDVVGHVDRTSRTSNDRIAQLRKKLEEAEERLDLATAAHSNASKVSKMLSAIRDAQKAAMLNAESDGAKKFLANPAKWAEVNAFFAERSAVLLARERECAEELESASQTVKTLKAKLTKSRSANNCDVEKGYVDTTLDVYASADRTSSRAELPVKLVLSFNVFGGSWTPLYDLRLITPTDEKADAELDVSYYAEVSQTTLVDWVKVPLSLSTALPHLGASPPVFPTPVWRISLQRPAPTFARDIMGARLCAQSVPLPTAMGNVQFDSVGITLPPEVEEATLSPTNFLSSATHFNIAGLTTVRADGKKVRLTIAQRRLPVKTTYTSVPRLNPNVYLTGKAQNTSPFLLLPGAANVFYNNTFVSKSKMALVFPGEKFAVSLGSDEAVMVTVMDYDKKQKTAKDGVFSAKKTVHDYHYDITVENKLTLGSANVVIRDRYPISTTPDNLKITLVSPDPKKLKEYDSEFADGASVNPETNIVEWHMCLKPKEKRTVSLQFNAKYPQNYNAFGL